MTPVLCKELHQSSIKKYSLILSACLISAHAFALQPLSEAEMAKETGQSLLNVVDTPAATSGVNNGIGFTRLGLQASVDINANIKKLQLGCGGANHPTGGCDIDIDDFSISGRDDGTTARPATDAKITNPFLEFAIKDPKKASTRQIVGMRFGADKMNGMMTFGKENSATPNGINAFSGYMTAQSDSSGKIYGTANSKPIFIDFTDQTMVAVGPQSPLYNPDSPTQVKQAINENIGTMDVYANVFGLPLPLGSVSFKAIKGGYWIPALTNLPFSTGKATINGNSEKNTDHPNNTFSVPDVIMDIPTTYLGRTPTDQSCGIDGHVCTSGNPVNGLDYPVHGVYDAVRNQSRTLGATIWTGANGTGTPVLDNNGDPIGATAVVTGTTGAAFLIGNVGKEMSNVHFYMGVAIKAKARVSENLGYMHKAEVNSPFSLSLQKQDIHWADSVADDIAKPGWWMSMRDPAYLGNMTPVDPIDLCPDKSLDTCLLPQVRDQINAYLVNNHPATSDIAGILSGKATATELGIANIDVLANMSNVQLQSQFFNSNCYGSGRPFC